MNACSIDHAISTPVPVRTMMTALVVAQRLAEDLSQEHLLRIARGNATLAMAIEYRLSLMATLLGMDPSIRSVVARLAPHQIAAVLAAAPLNGGSGDSSADELAAGLRLAASPTNNV